MKINYKRIKQAQSLMKEQGLIGLMILNHDDYRYFFGDIRIQPRAIIPVSGPPVFICFKSEEAELKDAVADENIKVAGHIGQQIADVKKTFHAMFDGPLPGVIPPEDSLPRVGMQMWFDTPAFLVDLFRQVNPRIKLVSSDPVMDELRMVKEPEEIEIMTRAQSIAATGMDRAAELIKPGISGHEIATETIYTMMKQGAEGTSTPIHINSGIRSCWIHGKVNKESLKPGDLVVIDLTPRFEGYCSNLARTFVVGEPNEKQEHLINTYLEIHESTRQNLKPGISIRELDTIGRHICERNNLTDSYLKGISHGIGLRFEETPASTIIPLHQKVKLRENMTVTIGHTILAIPGFGGVRFEDVYLVTAKGGRALHEYPMFLSKS